jgi:flagellar M-ring protein FliF
VAVINDPPGWLAMFHFTMDDLMRGIELVVMTILGLLVLLFVVRPMVRRIVTPEEAQPVAAIAAATGDAAALTGEGGDGKALQSPTAQMIDIAQVQGQVHAQSVQKVGQLAQQNPQETVSIIRQWLHESAA